MAYWRLGAIVFFSLPIFLLLAHQVVISYTPMLYLALIGCVGIFLNRVFFIHAHKFLGISHVAVTLLLVPLCTLLGSYVIFGNVFNPVQIF